MFASGLSGHFPQQQLLNLKDLGARSCEFNTVCFQCFGDLAQQKLLNLKDWAARSCEFNTI